jgi:beta-lactamase class A
MASTAKIAIGMLASAQVARGSLTLDEPIAINPNFLAPGFARSPMDHMFYLPFDTRRTETIDRLIGFMIRVSDNSATDALLYRIGGTEAVESFLGHLGIDGIHIARTFRQLVAFYYGFKLPLDRRPRLGQIITAIARLHRPFKMREATEQAMIDSDNDCCTPRAMADLLAILATDPVYLPVYSHMRHCSGGLGRIRKGLLPYKSSIKSFVHKTGGMGGIANDAGVVRFKHGSFAAICVMTCQSTTSMEIRNEQIAAATELAIGALLDGRLAPEFRSM